MPFLKKNENDLNIKIKYKIIDFYEQMRFKYTFKDFKEIGLRAPFLRVRSPESNKILLADNLDFYISASFKESDVHLFQLLLRIFPFYFL